nr:hypothetical protein [Streptomyces guryensis]
MSRKSAYAWRASWREGGVDALRSKGPSGVASRMRPSWRAWLAGALGEGPCRATGIWWSTAAPIKPSGRQTPTLTPALI